MANLQFTQICFFYLLPLADRMYIALDHSPLHFTQFEETNVYSTNMRLGYNIGMHYVSGAIFGAGWVVGSLEILGR